MSNYIIYDGELYHYGRKGMKWGQHIFGKIKKAAARTGKHLSYEVKSAAKGVKSAVNDAREKRANKKAMAAKRNKPISEMTDSELRDHINRLQLEKNALDLKKHIDDLNPKTVSVGEKFVKSAVNNVIAPSLVNAGKNVLSKWLEDKGMEITGMKKDTSLKDEVDALRDRKAKAELEDFFNKRDKSSDDYMDALKKDAEEWGYRKTVAEGKAKERAYVNSLKKEWEENNRTMDQTVNTSAYNTGSNVVNNLFSPAPSKKKKRKKKRTVNTSAYNTGSNVVNTLLLPAPSKKKKR